MSDYTNNRDLLFHQVKVGDVINNRKILRIVGEPFRLVNGKHAPVPEGWSGCIYGTYEVNCIKCDTTSIVCGLQMQTISCKNGPCSKSFKDLTNMRFGQLTILAYVPHYNKTKERGVSWLTRCDCGRETVVFGRILVDPKRPKTCCNVCARASKSRKRRLPESLAGWREYFSKTKRDSHKKQRAFDLSFEEFRRVASLNCAYCGAAPCLMYHHTEVVRNGIDRVDSKLGYTSTNVVACCKICNRMKMELDCQTWLEHVRKIAKHTEQIRSTTIPNGSTPKQVETERVLPQEGL